MRWVAPIVSGALALSLAGAGVATARPEAAATKRVAIKDNLFSPKTVTINKGSTVKWTNQGNRTHTVTFNTGSYDKLVSPGATVKRTFNKSGTFRYHCRIHDGMTGKVVVN
jgi:plastocyanin